MIATHIGFSANMQEDGSSIVGSMDWMRRKEAEMEARRALVKEVCAKYDSEDRWREEEPARKFWFALEHGFAFCSHPKV